GQVQQGPHESVLARRSVAVDGTEDLIGINADVPGPRVAAGDGLCDGRVHDLDKLHIAHPQTALSFRVPSFAPRARRTDISMWYRGMTAAVSASCERASLMFSTVQ